MCSVYSSNRRTRRWPMPVLNGILDMNALNAFIIQQSLERSSKMIRIMFLKGLAKFLYEPNMKERCYNQRLPTQLRISIATTVKLQLASASSSANDGKPEIGEE